MTRGDVIASFAGLRPLVRSKGRTKDISRRHVVDVGPGGMVTITGGKLTAWRRMANDAVDAALEAGEFDYRPVSRTWEERVAGAAFADGVVPALRAVLDDLGLDESHAQRLYHRYGSFAAEVLKLVGEDPWLGERLHPEAPYLRAEAEYAIATEMALTRLRRARAPPATVADDVGWRRQRPCPGSLRACRSRERVRRCPTLVHNSRGACPTARSGR